jgi:hypothetical protein
MPSLNFQQNLKKSFGTKDAWINHAGAIATGLYYPIVPKLLGLDGFTGMLVGAGVPALIGALTDTPGALHGALAVATTHLTYTHIAPNIFEDGTAWALLPDAGVEGLAESSIVTLPNGEQVTVYDLPESPTAMNDYYTENLNDYYTENLSDYYSEDQQIASTMNDEFQNSQF